ncbi:hypothetical protein [Labrenzia sp. MBR-25]
MPAKLLRLILLALVLLRLSPLRPVVFTLKLLALIVRPVLWQTGAPLSFQLQQANSFLTQLLNALSLFQFAPFLCQPLPFEFQNEHLLLQQRLVDLLLLLGQQGRCWKLRVLRRLRRCKECARKGRSKYQKCQSCVGGRA